MLGVSRDASHDRIKAAHRALVRRHHPDLAPPEERDAATRRVQQINVAYGLLRDEAARSAYDRALRNADPVLERLAATAGVWAGRWWERNRAALRERPPEARLSWMAGKAVGRMLRRGGS